MKLFGFNITRVRQEDEQELQVFKNTVINFNAQIIAFIKYMEGEIRLDINLINYLLQKIRTFGSYYKIYDGCKFSSPSNVFNMEEQMNKVSKCSTNISLCITEDIKCNMLIRDQFMDDYEKIDELRQKQKSLLSTINHNIFEMTTALRSILHIIEYDYRRIEAGVDIIKEYKHRQKQTLDKRETQYIIRFKRIKGDVYNDEHGCRRSSKLK